ncbi:MAG: glycoside hydrolase family 28 protein [Myxococcota bacterium]
MRAGGFHVPAWLAAVVGLLLLGAPAAAAECDVTRHGALGDGVTLETEAFRAAIAACRAQGGGTVRVPAGRYRIGAIELSSHITLELDAGATLVGSRDPADYPLVETRFEGKRVQGHAALVSARNAVNVAIVGRGTIDGDGAPWWELADSGALTHPRPRLIELHEVKGARVEGVTLQNSPSWTLHPVFSEDIAITGITITAPPEAPKTDGIDVDSSRDVRISDCLIDVGDDCIAIKSGRDEEGREVGRPSENITVTNCVLRRGHGAVVVGSEMSGDVRRVAVSNSVFEGTDRGLRIKTRRGRGGVVEDVSMSDVVMHGVAQPLVVNMFYRGDGGEVPDDAAVNEGTPTVRGVRVSNVVARGAERAAWLRGLPERPLEDVTLRGLRLEAREGLYAKDVEGLSLDGVDLRVATGIGARFRRVRGLEASAVRGLATPAGGEPWAELVNVRDAGLHGWRVPEDSTFLRVLGAESADIAVTGVRPASALGRVELGEGASETALEPSE